MCNWAKPGAKCVSIAGGWHSHESGDKRVGPSMRETVTIKYTVRREDGALMLCLVGYPEGAYNVTGFRPLIERTQQQDVALFHSLLTETRTPALV